MVGRTESYCAGRSKAPPGPTSATGADRKSARDRPVPGDVELERGESLGIGEDLDRGNPPAANREREQGERALSREDDETSGSIDPSVATAACEPPERERRRGDRLG